MAATLSKKTDSSMQTKLDVPFGRVNVTTMSSDSLSRQKYDQAKLEQGHAPDLAIALKTGTFGNHSSHEDAQK
jgi:hypothetical protein